MKTSGTPAVKLGIHCRVHGPYLRAVYTAREPWRRFGHWWSRAVETVLEHGPVDTDSVYQALEMVVSCSIFVTSTAIIITAWTQDENTGGCLLERFVVQLSHDVMSEVTSEVRLQSTHLALVHDLPDLVSRHDRLLAFLRFRTVRLLDLHWRLRRRHWVSGQFLNGTSAHYRPFSAIHSGA